ncbi:MAG: hypothetical protein KDD66_04465 [Bdellovibrionales bacterium]|nr:hypothetical protein [Bdellovibrionales bacterium]
MDFVKQIFFSALSASIVGISTAQVAIAQDGSGGITVGGSFNLTAEEVQQIRDETSLIPGELNMHFAGDICDALMAHAPGSVGQGAVNLGSLLGLCPSMEEMLTDGIEEINHELERMCDDVESLKEGRECTFTPVDIEPTCEGLSDFCKNGLNPYMGITVNREGDAYCWGRFTIPGCECNDKPRGRLPYYPLPTLQPIIDDLLWELLPQSSTPTPTGTAIEQPKSVNGQP